MTELVERTERRTCPCCGGLLTILLDEPLGEYGTQKPELFGLGMPGVWCSGCHRNLEQIAEELECRKA